jgi:hypothetical protein
MTASTKMDIEATANQTSPSNDGDDHEAHGEASNAGSNDSETRQPHNDSSRRTTVSLAPRVDMHSALPITKLAHPSNSKSRITTVKHALSNASSHLLNHAHSITNAYTLACTFHELSALNAHAHSTSSQVSGPVECSPTHLHPALSNPNDRSPIDLETCEGVG